MWYMNCFILQDPAATNHAGSLLFAILIHLRVIAATMVHRYIKGGLSERQNVLLNMHCHRSALTCES